MPDLRCQTRDAGYYHYYIVYTVYFFPLSRVPIIYFKLHANISAKSCANSRKLELLIQLCIELIFLLLLLASKIKS